MQKMAKLTKKEGLEELLQSLVKDYDVIGPVLKDGAIVYERISHLKEIPIGWKEIQEPGKYRLEKTAGDECFSYTVGPQSWKQFLFPPERRLFQARRSGKKWSYLEEKSAPKKPLAFFGIRACELAALKIQDRVFLEGEYVDSYYASFRKDLLLIAVNCGRAAKTCFCVSQNTGPHVDAGYDLAITEFTENGSYLVEAIGAKGEKFLKKIPGGPPEEKDWVAKKSHREKTEKQMVRKIDNEKVKAMLPSVPDHPRWAEVASRCLSCANCTMVCPTCFCSSVEETSSLSGDIADRWKKWDSCFTLDFSYLHGGSVRQSTQSRYRQWLTHKLSTWHEQFDSSGCVGCGRCISWCPVGIDITEEAAVLTV